MKKRTSILLVAVLLVVSVLSAFSLTACNEEQTTIVYLGDSIAEGIIGPSPLSERYSYSYYSVVGQRNGYKFYNRSVSGHQTKDMLAYLDCDDSVTGAATTMTLVKTADVIHVSIIGNDLLQTNIPLALYGVATNDTSAIDAIVADAAVKFAAIVAKLKSLNPNALLMISTVYNPVTPSTPMVNAEMAADLAELGDGPEDYRGYGATLIGKLNGVIRDYNAANPNDYVLIDVYKAFDDIYNQDAKRGTALIYSDGVHPSNEGHAVIADLIQKTLEEKGLAKTKSALAEYKAMRIEQLERLFSETEGVDVKAVKREIKKAKSCEEVTKVFFAATNYKVGKIAERGEL